MPRQRHHSRRARRGFTMVEVIVVVTVLALLAAVLTTSVIGTLGSSKTAIAKTQASKIAQALNMYVAETGGSDLEDNFNLEILVLGPDDGGGPRRYLPKADDIIDPWGNVFIVLVPGDINADFDILSYGKDGSPGGEGENEDVTQ
ncbi:MAG: type II secretion system protein GspG [Phycisphaerales bacterium]|nr:type II secretion system protein GspG [Phycisphaerales bacterium]